jgi:Pyruvate/2-oxoacid:ferredoxin oxidoreductase delta subunit
MLTAMMTTSKMEGMRMITIIIIIIQNINHNNKNNTEYQSIHMHITKSQQINCYTLSSYLPKMTIIQPQQH